jgi:hypothetical protein
MCEIIKNNINDGIVTLQLDKIKNMYDNSY